MDLIAKFANVGAEFEVRESVVAVPLNVPNCTPANFKGRVNLFAVARPESSVGLVTEWNCIVNHSSRLYLHRIASPEVPAQLAVTITLQS